MKWFFICTDMCCNDYAPHINAVNMGSLVATVPQALPRLHTYARWLLLSVCKHLLYTINVYESICIRVSAGDRVDDGVELVAIVADCASACTRVLWHLEPNRSTLFLYSLFYTIADQWCNRSALFVYMWHCKHLLHMYICCKYICGIFKFNNCPTWCCVDHRHRNRQHYRHRLRICSSTCYLFIFVVVTYL